MAMSRSLAATLLTTRSPIRIWPSVIASRPASMRRAVDLPQPEGPTRTMNSLSLMSTLKSLTTVRSAVYRLTTWSKVTVAMSFTPASSWSDLDFEPASLEEGIGGRRVLVQGKAICDHRFAVDDPLLKQRKRALEAVEHGHRSDDPELVVVDAEGGELRDGVRIGDAEHQERTAPSDSPQAVLDGRHDPRGVDHHVPAARPVQLVGRCSNTIGREPLGELMARGIRLDHVHVQVARSALPDQLSEQKAHRPGPIDEVGVGGPGLHLVQAMDGAGQWLDQGAPMSRHVNHERERIRRRDCHELGASAVDAADADRIPVLTEIEEAGAAHSAGAAEQGGVDGHEIAILDIAHRGSRRLPP